MAVTKEMKIKAIQAFCREKKNCANCPLNSKFFPIHCREFDWEDLTEITLDSLIEVCNITINYTPEIEPVYWSRICEMQKRQTEKGLKKYGQILEENTSMTITERLEYLEEELIDGLMYLEHIKEMLSKEGLNHE